MNSISNILIKLIRLLFILTFCSIHLIGFGNSNSESNNELYLSGIVEIDSNMAIREGQTLRIEKGATLIFTDYYNIKIFGKLIAIGTKEEPITFKINNTSGFDDTTSTQGGWNGIKFINCIDDTSYLEHCIIQNVKSTVSPHLNGSGIYLYSSNNVVIKYSVFQNNMGRIGGGIYLDQCTPEISNCIFKNNIAIEAGGGLYGFHADNLILNNCLFSGNHSEEGSAVSLQESDNIKIINTTITNNSSLKNKASIQFSNCKNIYIYNNIIYFNNSGNDFIPIIFNNCISYYVTSNNLENDNLFPEGWNNLDVDPVFVDINNEDYSLQNISPCIDAGKNKYQPGFYDIEENIRFWSTSNITNPIIDLGAYEYGAATYPELFYTKNDITNAESPDGSIQLTNTGGTPPYSYAWQDGSTDSVRYNLSMGNYKIIIEDLYGYKDSATIEIQYSKLFNYIKGTVHHCNTYLDSGTILAFEYVDGNYIYRNQGKISNGKYEIYGLSNTDYILYAIPDFIDQSELAPGYYVNKTYWNLAYLYELTRPVVGVDISLEKSKSTNNGPCYIIGDFRNIADTSDSTEYPILLSQDDNIISWSKVKNGEKFQFKNLSYGDYSLRLEYPGKINQKNYSFTLNKNTPNQNLLITLEDTKVSTYSMNDNSPAFADAECYPNPVLNNLFIKFNYFPVTNYKVAVYSIEGRLIARKEARKEEGKLTVSIELSEITPGTYIVKLLADDTFKYFSIIKK